MLLLYTLSNTMLLLYTVMNTIIPSHPPTPQPRPQTHLESWSSNTISTNKVHHQHMLPTCPWLWTWYPSCHQPMQVAHFLFGPCGHHFTRVTLAVLAAETCVTSYIPGDASGGRTSGGRTSGGRTSGGRTSGDIGIQYQKERAGSHMVWYISCTCTPHTTHLSLSLNTRMLVLYTFTAKSPGGASGLSSAASLSSLSLSWVGSCASS